MATTTRRTYTSSAALIALAAPWAMTLALAPSRPQHVDFPNAATATATMAWVQARCLHDGATADAASPRTQGELLLQVAAIFEAEAAQRPLADVCEDALRSTTMAYFQPHGGARGNRALPNPPAEQVVSNRVAD